MVLPGCIITSMGPYLQGSSFDKAFSSNGNFQNYVTGIEAYERMRERARHVSSESKAIAIRAAEARHLSTYGEPLQLPSCLAVIQNHCCYLSSPLLCGLNREEVSARMENLKSDIERIKLIFDQKVCKFICFTNFELNNIFIVTYWNSRLHYGEKICCCSPTASIQCSGQNSFSRTFGQPHHDDHKFAERSTDS